MKVITYHISPQQKELLIITNHKKHDITVIGNALNLDTLAFAAGKEALLIFNEEIIDASIIKGLNQLGIKYLATESFTTSHIDLLAAELAQMRVENIPIKECSIQERFQMLITILDNWAAAK